MPCSPLEVTGPLHTSLPAHWCVPGISPVVTSRCAWCAFSNAVCGECVERGGVGAVSWGQWAAAPGGVWSCTRPGRRPASRFQRRIEVWTRGRTLRAVLRGIAYVCSAASVLSDPATLWTVVLSGSSVHGISQTSILEWVAMPSSRGSSQSRDRICIS